MPVIKWSGSKRRQLPTILANLPPSRNAYYEPFVGSGSVIRSLESGTGSDLCKPLIDIWKLIQTDPNAILLKYVKHWNEFQKFRKEYYYETRKSFNSTQDPTDFYFLTRTAYNGLIRFNRDGKFTSPCQNSRPGMHPKRVFKLVMNAHLAIRNVTFKHQDYRVALKNVKIGDFVYLDPPFQNSDGMYLGGFSEADFFKEVQRLDDIGAFIMLSYNTNLGENSVFQRHIIMTAKSPFKTIQKKHDMVSQYLYMNYPI